jgi:hypothetical protein
MLLCSNNLFFANNSCGNYILIMHATSCMEILHEVVLVKNSLTINKMADYIIARHLMHDIFSGILMILIVTITRRHTITPRAKHERDQ